jgi:chemotaxis protein methyltransferase CheR
MTLPLSPQVFSIVASLIEEATGIHYALRDIELVADRISARALELGLDSILDYYYFVRYDAGGARELEQLVDTLVVNETYFFREVDQLRVLADRLVPEALAKRERVRVWCAATSTGEEPLTLSFLLDDRGLLDRVEIVATDISFRALARAREGRYSGRSLRAVTPAARATYFERVAEVPEVVRPRRGSDRAIRWARLNLFDTPAVRALGTFDVILCRNALLYFRDEAVARLLGTLRDSLVPQGLLVVGASESLLRFGTAFECEEHGGAFFYRRAEER